MAYTLEERETIVRMMKWITVGILRVMLGNTLLKS